LAAGVTFNFLLAWLLISLGFFIGMPYSTENELGAKVQNPGLMIINVLPESPAFTAGLKSGDIITSISRKGEMLAKIEPDKVSEFVNKSSDKINLQILRNGKRESFEIGPSENVLDGRFALGISMDTVGKLSLPLHLAFWHGVKTSISLLSETTKGLASLIIDAFRGRADISQITGPVGIVGIVGDASQLGFVYILTLAAFISINLAVINLLPFPSLDGGRILFVLIEAIKGSPVNPRFFNLANTIGFALLILLMLTITIRDIGNLF
ncbi:MAG: M50 family metallopeptidase, partial [Patescibacteria group bacterium]